MVSSSAVLGLVMAYPERFYAAASYAGFDGSSDVSSKFVNDASLLLYALYQQTMIGPCNIPKPRGWSPLEQGKWTSWNGLGNMTSTEAMRLFVKILEEEHPGSYSRACNFVSEPTADIQIPQNGWWVESILMTVNVFIRQQSLEVMPNVENGNVFKEVNAQIKTITSENGTSSDTQDKDIVLEDLEWVVVHDRWVKPPISGQRPRSRYEHGAALIKDKMYIYGGSHNGRYLNDLYALDLKSWTWSKVDVKPESMDSKSHGSGVPCAGHSLISWDNKLLSIAGHTMDPAETIQVKAFYPHTKTWSTLKTYGKSPVSRGGQSVTLVGTSLVIFGGQDAKQSLLNDLHILDLENMTWDEYACVGVPPSPRSEHTAAVHGDRYLLIFGGGTHATCFNDLHVLDLESMEWSRPIQQGQIPSPRAGHSGVTVGENCFIVGGGDNKSGISETIVLNMSTLTWSVVTSTQGHIPFASEGLSLVASSFDGEDALISFGGYNGRYSSEVHVLKPSHKSTLPSKVVESVTSATGNIGSGFQAGRDGRIREVMMDCTYSEMKRPTGVGSGRNILAILKAEKEVESVLNQEKLACIQLRQDLSKVEARNGDLYKELQSVRSQLASEQSRSFKLEVDFAELRQKLQTMETLERELSLLQRQKAASEEAALSDRHRQGSGTRWSWLTGTPPSHKSDDAL